MQYKIYECDTVVSKNGKEFKKLVLKAEGQENTEPRVTLWSDHPQYAEAKSGGTINGTLEKKDSGTPIPAHPGKNYVNRTLLAEGTGTAPSNLEGRVKKLEDKVFGAKQEETIIEYPVEDINPDDVPF